MTRIVPLLLTRADIEHVAPSDGEIVAAVEAAYRAEADGRAQVPSKIGVHPAFPNAFVHAMPAHVAMPDAAGDNAEYLGVKTVGYFPGMAANGYPDSTALIVLYGAEHGQPIAILEGMWITLARTAACAAVMAKLLAPERPERLGLVGCGGLGYWALRMVGAAIPSLRDIRVASRTRESRLAFCARFRGQGRWTLVPVDRTEDAVRGMDIVVSSTPKSPEPAMLGEWWAKGALAIPFDYPTSWDDAAYRRADRMIADNLETLARHELMARQGKGRRTLALPADREALQDVLAGRAPGRTAPGQRILGVVTGIASTDIVLAAEIYRRARARGLGTPFDFG